MDAKSKKMPIPCGIGIFLKESLAAFSPGICASGKTLLSPKVCELRGGAASAHLGLYPFN